jgi:hypothetical protein
MSQHKINVSLRHMLDHALEAVAMTKVKTRESINGVKSLSLTLLKISVPSIKKLVLQTKDRKGHGA